MVIKPGSRFGKWRVLRHVGMKHSNQLWRCRCDCGTVSTVLSGGLKNGHSTQCRQCGYGHGGLRSHGHTKGRVGSRTYISWSMMKQRCLNPNATYYRNYGGRGITLCKRWHKFENFLADMGERPAGMTIDRIENHLGYYPDNVKWSSRITQASNQRRFWFKRRPSKRRKAIRLRHILKVSSIAKE